MAIYTYRCRECGKQEEVVQSISSYCKAPRIPVCCDTQAERYLTAPMVSFDTAPWVAYKSPIDGSVIDSRAKRREHMAVHGVVPYDDLKPDIERNRKRFLAEAQAGVKDAVIEAVDRVAGGFKPQVESIDNITAVQ